MLSSGGACRQVHEISRLLATVAIVLATLSLGACSWLSREPSLRVMTYNVRHGVGMDGVVDLSRVAAVIAATQPDAVALQEIDVETARSGGVDQAAALATLAGFEHHAFGRFMDYDGGQYGMAILSRYPILSTQLVELPPGLHEPRTSLLVDIDGPGGSVVLVGVHFDWLDDDAARFAQAQALVSALEGETRPVAIVGDFNDVPGSRTIELLDREWTRIPKEDGAALTFPSHAPEVEIDLIYARGSVSRPMGSARVIEESVASDHRPVVAKITW